MLFNEKAKAKGQKQLIEALYSITKSKGSEIKLDKITWDVEKPILKLKGNNETPDFTITFGIDKNKPALAHVIPDCNPDLGRDFEMTRIDIKKLTTKTIISLTKDILSACSLVMLSLGINCYLAYYNGDYGLLKLTLSDKVLFLSKGVSLDIDIEIITDVCLLCCVGLPDLAEAIFIDTDSGKYYFIALEQPDKFAVNLEERVNRLRNIRPQIAS